MADSRAFFCDGRGLNRTFLPLIPILASSAAVFFLSGCVTPTKEPTTVLTENDDERATRQVYRDGWLRPSVTEDEKDFFYRTFWKSR